MRQPEVLNKRGKEPRQHVHNDEPTSQPTNQPTNPHSCTILIKGPNDHTIAQMKEAVRDGMRAVQNVLREALGVGYGEASQAAWG